MSFKRIRFPLSLRELQKLSESESGIVLRKNCPCRLKLSYSVLPVNSREFKAAIHEELNKRVLKYNSELNDMILRYSNIRVKTPIEATRTRKLPVLCIADVYVFKPQCENQLTATVNQKSENHIGCLMYNVFNVSIIKPPDLPFKQWSGRNVEVHDVITFKVVKVDVSDVIPYIIGELEPDNSSALNDERDSVISTDHNSFVTSDERYSDLEDVLETIKPKQFEKQKNLFETIESEKSESQLNVSKTPKSIKKSEQSDNKSETKKPRQAKKRKLSLAKERDEAEWTPKMLKMS